ncbi:MAG: DNA-binding protein [Azospira oryzae]|uniref:TraR/DksA family transcriptional regulator n=1 Tax=Pelomicrobium methylotrophicum TaxID=2602750 RepID=A0A5C7EVW9_9PROT|nr:TraR/DksA C4-type zinc finger protein [Pelomicrobium methylotrophicum]PZP54729.1 MAG: DNA-binding protein [Azospira oryzae]PZP77480.1 MAG: DNA-binding protein [Azospira oryzae]TXF11215.1 TraR/DksA family transcriptional regulator [Pelomicrobium methylotrophicum]
MDETYIGVFADESDRASAVEAIFNAEALGDARRKAQPETHPDFDGRHCVECGERIPKERLALGRVRCVECQTTLEHQRKLMRA